MKKTFVVKKKRKIELNFSHKLLLGIIFFSFIILFVVSCRYPKNIRKYPMAVRKNLLESCNECANRLTKYYSIIESDTFYYHIVLYDEIYHAGPFKDGWFYIERNNILMLKKYVVGRKSNGGFFKYYPSGNLYIEGNMVENKKQGVFLVFADSSELIITKILHYNRDSLINEYVFENDSIIEGKLIIEGE